ncbi:MAG: prepilin-type N-terminal cleavage/methylation domain-containing protein [Gallionella sp.]|nr:prepilin-type N-terminal cleavage/methylation domain-containing protein [Gallionella sp.]
MPIKRHDTRGFTLIEMAIVLLITGLLLGGLLIPFGTRIAQQQRQDTQARLDAAQEALLGHVLATGRFPCPADPTLASTTAGAGLARMPPCTGNLSSGALPWATLGLRETDAWGNRLSYRVSSDFADAIDSNTLGGCSPNPAPLHASFALCSTATLDILAASGGTTIAIDVPAIIISHGANGAGAYTPQGTQNFAGNNGDEQENSDNGADLSYVDHLPTPDYDDQLVWVSNLLLMNRMVAAGLLP